MVTLYALPPVALLLLALERVPFLRRVKARALRAGFAADLVLLFIGWVAGAGLVLRGVSAGSSALGGLGVPRLSTTHLPLWATTAAALVLIDLGNYLAHDLLHRVPALWRLHEVHHSLRTLDWLATFRSHPLEQLVRRLLAPLMLIAIGVPVDAMAIAAAIFTAWGMFEHANLRIGGPALEWLLITPRLHHVHHGIDTPQRNFGTMFSVWDRLLGRLDTHGLPADATLGTRATTGRETLLDALTFPFRAARRVG